MKSLNQFNTKVSDDSKLLNNKDYINIVLVIDNKIKQNFLFDNEDIANNIFVNLVCEYSDEAITRDWAEEFVKYEHFKFSNGFVQINRPILKFCS